MLKPALARGEIQCIGATTLDEYRKNIEKDGALERRFQKVIVDPTTAEETLQILRNIKPVAYTHLDCPPLGDFAGTMAMLIGSNPDINIHFSYHSDLVSFDISTRELKEILENMPLSHPKVMLYLKELIANQIVASG